MAHNIKKAIPVTQSVQSLQQKAHSLEKQGMLDEAEKIHKEIVSLQPNIVASWQFLSARAARRGDHSAAAFAIRQYIKADPFNPSAWQGLGINLMHLKDWEMATTAFQEAVTLQPDNRTNLLYLAGAANKAGQSHLAIDCFSLALQQTTASEVTALSEKAEPIMKDILLASMGILEDHLSKLALEAGPLHGNLKGARWRIHESSAPEWNKTEQQPERLFLPALPPQAWFDENDLNWVSGLENTYNIIASEVAAALSENDAAPYIAPHMAAKGRWASLAGNKDWSAIHLYNGGKPNEKLTALFPNTLAALEALPLCRVGEAPIEIFFSLLKPGTHIVPHFGTSNGRLTVHLPITVPAGNTCSLTADNQTHIMKPGKTLAFDDSFEHEARNDGNSLRVNLIFEAWHPDLSKAEQAQLSRMAEAYDDWFSGRTKRLDFLGVPFGEAVRAEQYFTNAEQTAKQHNATAPAKAIYEQALAINPKHKKALMRLADIAFAAGANEEGLLKLRHLAAISEAHARTQYRLAVIEEQIGSPEKAEAAYLMCLKADSKNMLAYLYAGYFYETKVPGGKEIAAHLYSLGQDVGASWQQLLAGPALDNETRRRAQSASRLLIQKMNTLHIDATKDQGGRIATAVWPQTHEKAVSYREANQKPHEFYIPGLAPIRYLNRTQMPWAETFEAAFEDIKTEFLVALSSDKSVGRPYLDASMTLSTEFDHIHASMNWAALDLYRNGIPNKKILTKFPKTCAALEKLPLATFGDAPFEVFFSQLQPGQCIPPHYGLSNHGITVHLPIIVPDNCRIRVEGEWRQWTEGELIAFDDSFEHEARNESDSLRVVLIFEIWHPDMTNDEIAALQRTFNARDAWIKARKIPDAQLF